jgi:hypothetical protein
MKRILVLGILSLTMSFPLAAQLTNQPNNLSVQSGPFVVQPASLFQPFQANARFYEDMPYFAPVFTPNPPFSPFPTYAAPQPPVVPVNAPPETQRIEVAPPEAAPTEEVNVVIGGAQPLPDESQKVIEGATPTVREKPSVGPVSGPPLPAAPGTVLALRNGGQLEVQAYAIAGDTLSISDGQGPRRLKLSDLDVAKTERLNKERGVRFVVPAERPH